MNTVALLEGILGDLNDGHHGWGGGWMWLWGTVMMLAFIGLVAFAFRGFTRHERDARHTDRHADPTRTAREILAERYARGEIELGEYREKLRELDGNGR